MDWITRLSVTTYLALIFTAVPVKNLYVLDIQDGLTISFEKTSMATAALKDTQEEVLLSIESIPVENLQALKMTSSEPEILMVQKTEITFEEGLTISKDDFLLVQEEIEKDQVFENIVADLSPSQANRLMLAANRDEILSENWQAPTLEEVVAKKIWQEQVSESLATAPQEVEEKPWNPIAQDLKAKSKPTYIVSRRVENKKEVDVGTGASFLVASNDRVPSNTSAASDVSSIEGFTNKDAKGLSAVVNDFELRGSFEFTKGLAFLFGEHNLVVAHQVNGEIYSQANINWQEGSFSLPVGSLQGSLVAYVYDREGFVIGEANVSLDGLQSEDRQVTGFYLPIQPFYTGYHIESISAHSFEKQIFKEPGVEVSYPGKKSLIKTNQDSIYHDRFARRGSQSNFMFRGKGRYTSTKVIHANEKTRAELFDDTMIQALLENLQDQGMESDPNQRKGIIWGKLDQVDGSGLLVQLSDTKAFGPVYFNQYHLPQRGLMTTTKNGYFIFAGVEPGLHTLEFFYNGKKFGKVVEVFERNVSLVTVNTKKVLEQNVDLYVGHERYDGEIETFVLSSDDTQLISAKPLQFKSIYASTSQMFEFRLKDQNLIYRIQADPNTKNMNLNLLSENVMLDLSSRYMTSQFIVGKVGDKKIESVFLNQEHLRMNQVLLLSDKYEPLSFSRQAEAAYYIIPIQGEGSNQIEIFYEDGSSLSQYLFSAPGVIHIVPEYK